MGVAITTNFSWVNSLALSSCENSFTILFAAGENTKKEAAYKCFLLSKVLKLDKRVECMSQQLTQWSKVSTQVTKHLIYESSSQGNSNKREALLHLNHINKYNNWRAIVYCITYLV